MITHYEAATIHQFDAIKHKLELSLLKAPPVPVDQWHAQDVSNNPTLISKELQHVILEIPIPPDHQLEEDLAGPLGANLPWAEDQFQERVSGEPMNPPPSEAWWPYAVKGNARHKEGEKFSHTYPERYWPRYAGDFYSDTGNRIPAYGIRYAYGDLNDVVVQLQQHPLTRQAYLPVFFPEDTGARDGQRIPCSLGYHFLQRDGILDVTYFIRSCDFVRHFSDDIYMTMRLGQWVAGKIGAEPGTLLMHISSLHLFVGDVPLIEAKHSTEDAMGATYPHLYGDSWY